MNWPEIIRKINTDTVYSSVGQRSDSDTKICLKIIDLLDAQSKALRALRSKTLNTQLDDDIYSLLKNEEDAHTLVRIFYSIYLALKKGTGKTSYRHLVLFTGEYFSQALNVVREKTTKHSTPELADLGQGI